jgi:hypothetical protein
MSYAILADVVRESVKKFGNKLHRGTNFIEPFDAGVPQAHNPYVARL